jgi:hypothetical protein
MHAYFRNHQLYLAEKCEWMDRHVAKTSRRALLKIESWKLIAETGEQDEHFKLVRKLVTESLLTPIHNRSVLHKEGFYYANLNN